MVAEQDPLSPSSVAPGEANRPAWWTNPVLWAGILLTTYTLAGAWDYGRQYTGIDFYQQEWIVPRAVVEFGITDIYSDAGRRRMEQVFRDKATREEVGELHQRVARSIHTPDRKQIDVTGTPLMYAVFRLFASGDYDRDFHAYLAFCVGGFAAAVVLLCRALGYSPAATWVVLPLLTFIEPFRSELRVLNVNCFQLLTLAAILYLRRWSHLRVASAVSGVALGLGAMFKPTVAPAVAFLAAVWLINRRRRQLWACGGVVIGLAAGFLVGSAFFGSWTIWFDFAGRFGEMFRAPWKFQEGNYSWASLVRSLNGRQITWELLAAISAAAMGCLWLGRRRGPVPRASDSADRARALREDFLAVGLGCTATLAASQLTWLHYYLLLIPLALYALRPSPPGAEALWAAVARRVLAAAALFVMSDWPRPALSRLLGEDSVGLYFCAAMAVILVLGLWEAVELRRIRPVPPTRP